MAERFERARRRSVRILIPVLVGVIGTWLGMAVGASTTVRMGPFQVRLDAGFGRGDTDIVLPPLGKVTADTHLAPLRLSATLQEVNVQQLTRALTDQGLDAFVADLERDAIDRLLPYALRVTVVALVGAFALSLLVFRRNRRAVEVAMLAALVALVGSEALAVATFRAQAFLSPSFSGSLALAPRLVGPVESATQKIDDFQVELQRVVDGAVRAYTSVQANPLGKGNEVRILHISDIHLSPLGFEYAQQIAQGFDVDFVIDTGDITSFGTPAESLILQYIPGFDRPYVFVRGSHDSLALQDQVAKIANATVLDGTTKTLDGITIYGLGDPVFVSNRSQPLSGKEFADQVQAVDPRLLNDVESLPTPPDIVAVHDDRMAELVAGHVPLVISGHFHENTARVTDGTLFLRVGTTGGAGPTTFTFQGGVPLSAEILYLRPTVDDAAPQLVAWDVVEQSPQTGDLSITRHLVEQQFGALTPSPVPTPSPTPVPTPSGSVSPSG